MPFIVVVEGVPKTRDRYIGICNVTESDVGGQLSQRIGFNCELD